MGHLCHHQEILEGTLQGGTSTEKKEKKKKKDNFHLISDTQIYQHSNLCVCVYKQKDLHL